MPLLSVSANDIDAAGLALDAELPIAWLDAELADASVTASAGRVQVRLSRSGDDIVVRGRVRAAFTVPCARCTQPAAVEVDTELSLFLQPAPAPKAPKAPKHAGSAPKPSAYDGGSAPKPSAYDGGSAPKPSVHDGGSAPKPSVHDGGSAPKPSVHDGGSAPKPPPGKGKGNGKADEEYEFSAAEADCDTYDGETVELDPFVREAILLEVPNFPLCSEGCPGIRPAAESAPIAAAPRLDPRLAPLADMKLALRARLKGLEGLEGATKAPPEPSEPAPQPARPQTKKKE